MNTDIPVNSLVLVCITLACLSVTAARRGYDILLAVTAACFVNLDFLWVINLLITFKYFYFIVTLLSQTQLSHIQVFRDVFNAALITFFYITNGPNDYVQYQICPENVSDEPAENKQVVWSFLARF